MRIIGALKRIIGKEYKNRIMGRNVSIIYKGLHTILLTSEKK